MSGRQGEFFTVRSTMRLRILHTPAGIAMNLSDDHPQQSQAAALRYGYQSRKTARGE